MMNMFTGRFWSVRASSTTRMRSLAASSLAVKSASSAVLVYGSAGPAGSGRNGSFSYAVQNSCGPQWPIVVPATGAEYGCGFAVPSRARTRHWKRSPSR